MKLKLFLVAAGMALFLLPSLTHAAPSSASIVELINNERASHGLPTLHTDPQLSQAAQGRAGVLANAGYIYHTSSPAGTPWPELKAVGYTYIYSGENLAVGYSSADVTISQWMNSPSHRANILSTNYQDIGVGIVTGDYNGRQAPYVVVFFGQKRKEPVAVTQTSSLSLVSSGVINSPTVNSSTEETRILTQLISLLTSLLSVSRASASM